jgi:Zn finger protein HypA/HybF involved in hydrogenase expression
VKQACSTSVESEARHLLRPTFFLIWSLAFNAFYVAKGINLFINFYRSNFDDYDEYYIKQIIAEITSFQEFVDVRLSEIVNELSSSSRPYHEFFKKCSICGNDSIIIDEEFDGFKCLFCENSFESDDFIMSRSEGPIDEICPNCGRKSIAFILYNNEAGADICGYCNFIAEYPEGEDWEEIKRSAYNQ